MDPLGLYGLYLLERPPFHFPLINEPHAAALSDASKDLVVPAFIAAAGSKDERSPFNVPTLAEWREIWKAWDLITLGMIPPSMLHEKPIDLRHRCLFYLGHVPAYVAPDHTKLSPGTESYPGFWTSISPGC